MQKIKTYISYNTPHIYISKPLLSQHFTIHNVNGYILSNIYANIYFSSLDLGEKVGII